MQNTRLVQMTNEEYHADRTAISSSGLKLMAKSPKHLFCSRLEKKEPTDAMKFGTLVHTVTLEPGLVDSMYCVMPDGLDKRTKEGKAFWAEFQEKSAGKEVVKEDDMKAAMLMAESVLEHPSAALIRLDIGEPECTIFWDEDLGDGVIVRCKARLDWFVEPHGVTLPLGLITDLKTTKDAGDGFQKDAYNLGYFIQAAFYCRGFMALYGLTERPPFTFIAVEKEPPYGVVSYQADAEFLDIGWKECERLLRIYAECMNTDTWPCYSTEIKPLSMPKWAKELYNG